MTDIVKVNVEAELFAQTFATADQKAGMLAFLEKRDDAQFPGL